MNRECDIEGELYLFDTEQSGRKSPVFSGYRPIHRLYDNYLSSGRHEYPDVQSVAPGDTVRVRAWLVTPEVYPGCLWIGREIDVMEGAEQIVGKLTVTRIFNKILLGDAGSYNRIWVEPDYLD
jgi:translation elongation factor EF-Tu-like GTPase